MSSRGRSEDIATLLYIAPFAAAFVYALVLWVQEGISLVLPTTVYLTVTRDPYLFIGASIAIMLGVVIEVSGTEPGARPAKLISLGNTLQSIAVAALVLVLISALYTNAFTDLGGAATDFLVGRYGVVFPALLVLFSYLVTAQFRLESLMSRKVLAVVALLLVPASLYEIGKRQTVIGIFIALFFLLVGIGLFLVPEKKKQVPKQE